MKRLTLIALIPALMFAQKPAPKPATPAAKAPVVVTEGQLPVQVQLLILQQQVAALQAQVAHIHNEDVEQIYQWLRYFKNVTDSLTGQNESPTLKHDQSQDKF